jgi:TadE-like protein
MSNRMSPSRGSARKRGLTFASKHADKSRMNSPSKPQPAPARAGRERERGQALVEFALIAPLFLLLVVGIIQFGIGLNYWLDLNRIANQGARWAAVDKYPNCNGTVGTPGCGVPATATNPTLKTYLESEPVSGGLQPTASICFDVPAPPALPALAGTVGQPVTVRVESDFTFLPIMNLAKIRLRGKATMRIEQDPVVLKSQGISSCT